jgi:hypothetical protein
MPYVTVGEENSGSIELYRLSFIGAHADAPAR